MMGQGVGESALHMDNPPESCFLTGTVLLIGPRICYILLF